MKTFAKIVATAGIIILVILLVINGLQTPEIPEGEEPTKAQALIILLKENINTATATLGISFSTLIAFLIGSIQKATATASGTTAETLDKANAIGVNMNKLQQKVDSLTTIINLLSTKQNISSKILTDTLLASDMPAETRAKINAMWDAYLAAEPQKEEVEQTPKEEEKTAEIIVEPPKTEEKKEESAPIYF